MQCLEPVLGGDEDEIDFTRDELLSGRIEIIGYVDQIDALAEGLVQLLGVDTTSGAPSARHEDRPKGLWHLLMPRPKRKRIRNGPRTRVAIRRGCRQTDTSSLRRKARLRVRIMQSIQPAGLPRLGIQSSLRWSAAATNSTNTSSNGGT